MRLSVKAFTLTCGLIWGGALLVVGLCNLASPGYGEAFLRGMSSVYPGYHATRSLGDVLVGTGYGLVDGGLGGLIFAWLYNVFAGGTTSGSSQS
jgi:hypothetical protein